MKKTSIFSAIITFVLVFPLWGLEGFAQTIRRVNNNSGVTGVNVYTTIQAAHDAAVANDIISIEPSVTSYGALDCRKPLKIIGNGFYLNKVSNGPQDTRSSTIGTITFNNGSAGSTLTGADVQGTLIISDLNIAISRCKTAAIYSGQSANQVASQHSQGNNATINKCMITSTISGYYNSSLAGNNWVISNNIVYFSAFSTLKNSLITNNTIYYPGNPFSGNEGTLISNNIIDGRGTSSSIDFTTSGVGSVFANNITLGVTSTPTTSGNISNASPTTTFLVANPWPSYNTEDGPFKLAVGSPAIGVGFGGVDCGAYGNTSPYIQAGLPPIPLITSFLTSAIGNTTNPLTVNVAVRSNN
jgi:hypothetical protein